MPHLLKKGSPELGLFVAIVVIGVGVLIGALAIVAEVARAIGF
jgi:hypothetical protein